MLSSESNATHYFYGIEKILNFIDITSSLEETVKFTLSVSMLQYLKWLTSSIGKKCFGRLLKELGMVPRAFQLWKMDLKIFWSHFQVFADCFEYVAIGNLYRLYSSGGSERQEPMWWLETGGATNFHCCTPTCLWRRRCRLWQMAKHVSTDDAVRPYTAKLICRYMYFTSNFLSYNKEFTSSY